MKIKLLLSEKDWKNVTLDDKFLRKINTDIYKSEKFKNTIILINNEIDNFKHFLIEIGDLSDNIVEYVPKFYDTFTNDILESMVKEIYSNKEILKNLYLNNNNIFYYLDIDNFTNEILKFNLEEQSFYNMLLHIVKLTNPLDFQREIEYLKTEYLKEDANDFDIHYAYHKMFRQSDVFDGHIDSILWNMLQLTDVPHRVFKLLATK